MERHDIELEVIESWPSALRQLVEERRDAWVAYQHERARIDRLGWTDVRTRTDPPPNAHRPAYEASVAQTEDLLHGHRLVGYHCTRLTPHERRRIRTDGLRVLSPGLVQQRLQALVDAGEMSRAQCDALLHSTMLQAHLDNRHGHRTGMVWLCPNRSTLRGASEVYRLFRSWGGESLYAGFENDAATMSVLSQIGQPAIVQCAVPLPTDDLHGCRAAQFLSNAVLPDVRHPEPSPTFDWCVRRDLAPDEILDIISFEDPRFDALTAHRQWAREHRLG